SVRAAGVKLGYRLLGDPADVSSATSLGVYRIIQESLANIAKHAPHQPAGVLLDLTGDGVRLEVRNGLPAAAAAAATPRRQGAGLPGMAERAAQLGGTFSSGPDSSSGPDASSGPDGGEWVVRLHIPAADDASLAAPGPPAARCIVKAVADDWGRR
ncbi:MAG TPA: hypothetical protein VGI31_08485, partial [Streptosporangiaceae bacterium]